ncbi:MAG: hypothetical protein ABIV10_04480 [Gemmatimonadaceae bacterium]
MIAGLIVGLIAITVAGGGAVDVNPLSLPTRSKAAVRVTAAFARADSARCRFRVLSQRRVRMLDGRNPYVASFSEAWRGAEGMFMGQPVYLFGASARFPEEPLVRDSLIGLLIDTSGVARPVATPLTGGHSLYPRVINSIDRGWEVIFVRSPLPDGAPMTPDAPAELWAGHFDGTRWSELTRVATTRGASLRPEFTSRLVRNRLGELAFAFPRNGLSPTPGIVLLRRAGGRWRADSLPTPERVDYVGVEPGPEGDRWILVYRSPDLASENPSHGTIYTVTVDSVWQKPRAVVHGLQTKLTDPVLARIGNELIESWWQREDGVDSSAPTHSVRWARIDTAGAVHAPQTSIAAPDRSEFRLTPLGRHTALWVMRDFSRASHVSLSAWHAGTVVELGPLELTNDTGMAVVAQDDSTVSMLSSRIGVAPSAPPVASTLTIARLGCMQ